MTLMALHLSSQPAGFSAAKFFIIDKSQLLSVSDIQSAQYPVFHLMPT